MNIHPKGSKLLIEIIKTENVRQSGIIVSQDKKVDAEIAKVLAVSDEIEKDQVKVGDKILFKAYDTDTVVIDKANEETADFIDYQSVIAVITD
jgi:co-chaperonin GroES (HSP10)